jgi:hypothetical protein
VNKQLDELVEGAFDYHPFGWNRPKVVGQYAIGPAFMAYCPGYQPKERAIVYTEASDTGYMLIADSLIRNAPDPDPELTVLKDAHKRMRTKENCKARALALGEYEMDIELAYPMYKLMRFFKPDRFALDGDVLYAWDGERIVFVGRTRPRVGNCVEASDVQKDQ